MSFVGDVYGKRALDFVEAMQRLESFDEIMARIKDELEWFGFDFVTVSAIPGSDISIADCVLMNTRPTDYEKHYIEKNYIQVDPVILALRSFATPFSWGEVRRQKLSKAGLRILDEGRDFGAKDGLIIPIINSSGEVSIFSPCGRAPDLSPRARSALDMIGVYSTQSLQRAARKDFRRQPHAPLTNREREIMRWVAIGKSDDEIATILSISKTTATTHVENAKRKLNATRRPQAVVQALRLGEITL